MLGIKIYLRYLFLSSEAHYYSLSLFINVLNFSLIPCGSCILHPYPTYLPAPHFYPLPIQPPPSKK